MSETQTLEKAKNAEAVEKWLTLPKKAYAALLKYEIKHVKNSFFISTPVKYYKIYRTGYSHKMYSAIDIMNSMML